MRNIFFTIFSFLSLVVAIERDGHNNKGKLRTFLDEEKEGDPELSFRTLQNTNSKVVMMMEFKDQDLRDRKGGSGSSSGSYSRSTKKSSGSGSYSSIKKGTKRSGGSKGSSACGDFYSEDGSTDTGVIINDDDSVGDDKGKENPQAIQK